MFRSGAIGLLAAASPSAAAPAPANDFGVTAGATHVKDATAWVDQHWEGWLLGGLKIAFIVVLAIVLRAMVHKVIHRLVAGMRRPAEAEVEAEVSRLGGLLANSGVVNTERRQQRSEAIGSVLRSMSSFLILGTAALMVLSALGMDLGPLLASAGVAGVAIGFGARNLVTDFLSGVFMIMEDQYGVGDEVDTGVASGTVLEVGLRVTKLRGSGGEIWYIRNGEVKRIANMSQGWGTATVDVQVGYNEDLTAVRAVITETAEQLSKETPYDELIWGRITVLGVESVASDSVVLRLEARTTPGKTSTVSRALRQRLKESFDQAGVKLKEDAVTPTAPPPVDVNPPSVLGDPNSARSLATKPIPLPEQSDAEHEHQQH